MAIEARMISMAFNCDWFRINIYSTDSMQMERKVNIRE